MNYKKSILSLVTIIALNNIALADTAATYLPLTTPANDTSWTLFGVNGYSNGVPSNAVAGPTSFSSGLTELDDASATDDVATSGLNVAGGDLASLQGLSESGLTSVKVGVNISNITFEATEPVRSMYIKVNDTDPNVKFNYKAALEGKNMEIIINGSTTTLYSVTISQESTWNNAAVATEGVVTSTVDTSARTTILTVLDADSTDNPINPANWDKDTHYSAYNNVDDNINFYRFDAITQEWKIYKNKNSAAANDFDSFDKGSAYWGRVDLGDDATNNADGATSLILGTSGNSAQSQLPAAYLDENNVTKLAKGWNMLAFDDIKPYIRHAATGLVLSGFATGDDITITDETGIYSTGTITFAGANEENWAKQINVAIESLRLRGLLPLAFTLKAFFTGNAGELVLISDAKFGVDATGAAAIPATTLTGADPFVSGAVTAVADVQVAAATVYSAYGEYALMINALVGANTIDGLASGAITDGANAKILFGDSLNSDHSAITMTLANASTFAGAVTNIKANATTAEASFVPTITPVDTDFDGTADMMIIAEAEPFYIKDNTFTRVFTTTTTAADNTKAFAVVGDATALIEPALNDDAAAIATETNLDFGTTALYAAANSGATKLVLASTSVSTLDAKDVESATDDFLATTTEAEDIARGAVKGVYSLDALAKKPLIQHSFPITFTVATDEPDEAGDRLSVAINGLVAVNLPLSVNAGGGVGTMTTAEKLAWFDGLVTGINTVIGTNTLHGYASHDYTEAINDFTGTTLTIEGVDIQSVVLAEVADVSTLTTVPTVGADTNVATAEELGAIKGDLVEDLKFNAVYTPNYANYGPLYTMRDAGFDVKAILRGTTKFSDESITWDSIDITRNEDDWFIQNEFNLFSVNLDSGYWVYLAPKSADAITISGATFTPSYSYYFDNDVARTTTNNVVGGQLRVTVDGLASTTASLAGSTSNVYALIAGEEVQMKINSGTEYTADITKFESIDFKEIGTDISFTIRATNGKGEAVKLEDAIMFDYAKPDAAVVSYPDASSATFTSASTDAIKFYVFKDFIPESASARSTALISNIDGAGGIGTSNICASFDFGVVNTLRVVAADGEDGSANISDAAQFKYASLFKGASVITHLNDGVTDKSQLATVYDATCTLEATQPTAGENTGVSIKALVANKSASISYIADKTVSFNTNLAWDAIYSIAGVEVIQLQNVEVYAGDKFLIEYDGNLYEGNFPGSQAAADATVAVPIVLTQITPDNKVLVP